MPNAKQSPPSVFVADIMVSTVIKVAPEWKLWEVAEMMMRHLISGAPVVDKMDRVITIIGEGDTLRLSAEMGQETQVQKCMEKLPRTQDLITLKKDNTFTDAYRIFMKHKIHRIPVVDGNGTLKGLVTRSMILRMMVEAHHGKKITKTA
jgi:predicted transcriptional regulator